MPTGRRRHQLRSAGGFSAVIAETQNPMVTVPSTAATWRWCRWCMGLHRFVAVQRRTRAATIPTAAARGFIAGDSHTKHAGAVDSGPQRLSKPPTFLRRSPRKFRNKPALQRWKKTGLPVTAWPRYHVRSLRPGLQQCCLSAKRHTEPNFTQRHCSVVQNAPWISAKPWHPCRGA